MSHMFSECNKLKKIDVRNFDTSKVTSFEFMFSFCESLGELDVSRWNTANCENMKGMFYDLP